MKSASLILCWMERVVLEIVDSRKGYRGTLEIIRDVLLVVGEAGDSGSKKTHIMYGANLSYKLLTRYLEKILYAGLVCEGESCYVITEKGRKFLQSYEDYEEKLKEIENYIDHLNSGKETLEKMLEC